MFRVGDEVIVTAYAPTPERIGQRATVTHDIGFLDLYTIVGRTDGRSWGACVFAEEIQLAQEATEYERADWAD